MSSKQQTYATDAPKRVNVGLFANSNKIDRDKIINTFNRAKSIKIENDGFSSNDVSHSHWDIDQLIDGNNNKAELSMDQFRIDQGNAHETMIKQTKKGLLKTKTTKSHTGERGGGVIAMLNDTHLNQNAYESEDSYTAYVKDNMDMDTPKGVYNCQTAITFDDYPDMFGGNRDNGENKINKDFPKMKSSSSYGKFNSKAVVQYEDAEIADNKVPICREIILKDSDIPDFSKVSSDPVTKHDVEYPKFSLGFNHWIHASKNKTNIFNTFTNKKRVYQVINGYERYIDDYDESIGNISKNFFGLGDKSNSLLGNKPNILSRAFYKLWEILYFFDLIDINDKNFVSAHLAEGPGSFIQATMFFREMFSKDSKNDKYHAITIHSENEDISLDLEKEFVQYYAKEKPQRFFMHKTYDAQTAGGSKTKDTGDLTETKTLENFKKDIGAKVDFVSGDGGFEWDNENIQEQECAILIYAQILAAIIIQKKGGHFVLKVFEMFTGLSAKFILLLKYFYEEVYIIKPFTSRESNSERYIVCRKFKFEEKQIVEIVQNMMKGLDEINSRRSSKNDKALYLFDIFPLIKVPDNLMINMISINTEITNQQFCVINKMIEYLNGSNFHGELYMRYKNRQINLAKHWIELFISDKSDYDKIKVKPRKLLEDSAKNQKIEYNRFRNNLVGFDVPKEPTKPAAKPAATPAAKPAAKLGSDIKKISRIKKVPKSKSNAKSKSKSKSSTDKTVFSPTAKTLKMKGKSKSSTNKTVFSPTDKTLKLKSKSKSSTDKTSKLKSSKNK